MKLATAGTVAMYLPNLHCRPGESSFTKVLSQPGELQHICDATTIKEIGGGYQKQVNGESSRAALEQLLAIDTNNKPLSESSNGGYISTQIAKKVQSDFAQNKTIVVNGWILSVTEARQCALFSLIEN